MKWIALVLVVLGMILAGGTAILLASLREGIMPSELVVVLVVGVIMAAIGGVWLFTLVFMLI